MKRDGHLPHAGDIVGTATVLPFCEPATARSAGAPSLSDSAERGSGAARANDLWQTWSRGW
eukprot:CAMPEP_0119316762 /NCGR_PEP_ID=MMETSP1333-20130426/40777_1 /TAXON_ID=418940 /ORGANISM="Scyphosphaera apsteinii, Strain RCC1455" /LENGTH=60 /DNA_ID=CAMNT_0007322499 /DNA_START=896 /DNA_END=1075 /DNA_ORIENTATION=+